MLLLVTCMSALLQAQFPTCMDVHLKQFCMHEILCTKIVIYEDLQMALRSWGNGKFAGGKFSNGWQESEEG